MKKIYGFISLLLIIGFQGFAQTSLVSNLAQEPQPIYWTNTSGEWCAQVFTTDNQEYNLQSVTIRISDGPSDAVVKLYNSDGVDVGTQIASFGSGTNIS